MMIVLKVFLVLITTVVKLNVVIGFLMYLMASKYIKIYDYVFKIFNIEKKNIKYKYMVG